MKKIAVLVLSVFLTTFIFSSFSPSLDGRAVIADEGVMPEGVFARTVGYLPGDSISVTNLAKKSSIDILVIGALDPSEGVAILLSPEAAKLLGMEKGANNVVKITKRSGQLDEQVSGTAVIADAPDTPVYVEKSEIGNDQPEESPFEEGEEVASDTDSSENEADASGDEEDFAYSWKDEGEGETNSTENGSENTEVAEASSEKEDDTSLEEQIASDVPSSEAFVEEEIPDEKVVLTDDLSESSENEVASSEKVEPETSEITSETTPAEVAESKSEEEGEVIVATVTEDVPESEPFVEKIEEEAENRRLAYSLEEEKVDLDDFEAVDADTLSELTIPDDVEEVPYSEDETDLALLDENKAASEEAGDKTETDVESDKVSSDDFETSIASNTASESSDNSTSEEISEGEAVAVAEEIYEEPIESEKIGADVLTDLEPLVAPEKLTVNTEENLPVEENTEKEEVSAVTEVTSNEDEYVMADELSDLDEGEKVSSSSAVVYDDAEVEEEGYAPIILVQSEPKAPEKEEKDYTEKVSYSDYYEDTPVVSSVSETVNTASQTVSVKEEIKEEKPKVAVKKNVSWEDYVTDAAKLEKNLWYVQIATLSDSSNIESLLAKYCESYPMNVVPLASGRGYQVLVGSLSMDEYGTVLNRFKSYGFKDAFVKKIR